MVVWFRRATRRQTKPNASETSWTGLYAAVGAAATVVARRVATKVWHVATGEEPPTKK